MVASAVDLDSAPATVSAASSGAVRPSSSDDPSSRRKEVYSWTAPHSLYACAWASPADASRRFRLAAGSFVEEYSNKISIVQLNDEAGELTVKAHLDHAYPATKLMWLPGASTARQADLLASSGDYLRLWSAPPDSKPRLESLMNPNRTSEYCAPLTSFDWNEADTSLIGTASIDTTCTVWQIETNQVVAQTRPQQQLEGSVRTQLIAHDREVFDIAFSRHQRDIFASVGGDGSLRMFDLRHLEHSTITYEDPQRQPLLRLAWNRQDSHYLATFAAGSHEVVIVDIRLPCAPVARLNNQRAQVNGIAWAPHSSCHICTVGDDRQALIWDIHEMPKPIEDPILAYQARAEVNQVQWSAAASDWIAICFDSTLEILRV